MTLEDVARVAGVSRATVSRVVNQQRRVAPAVRKSVMAAVEEIGYVPNRAARSLVTRKAGAVVVVVSGLAPEDDDGSHVARMFSDPFFGRVAGGVVRALRPLDVHPVLMLADTVRARSQVLAFLEHGSADGALLVSTHVDDPLPGQLVELGRPAVVFARPSGDLPISFVDAGNADGGRLAAKHLISRGRRNLGVVSVHGPLNMPALGDRVHGFRDGAAREGVAYVAASPGDLSVEGGDAAVQQLLADSPDLDGVFACNDLMAVGAIQALRRAGRRVPQDVSVVGFDDSSIAALSDPPLTTVRQPIEEMAGEMAHLLMQLVDEPERRVMSAVLDPTLVERDSA
ncbi:LacI family transcriptional regulator [Paraoerskovia sediminicola]|uniref:LacI family transcriptional regulator n=1 Tax=Paraoerskovia sediminicola TaxID=1138587 RepID=A0ABM8G0E5_9CELL|nr:LacI family transcriptional regulator [Paraoerskovia sediminicola]